MWRATGFNSWAILFLVYVNELNNTSVLDPIMFADDTNLFYSHQNKKKHFWNGEL